MGFGLTFNEFIVVGHGFKALKIRFFGLGFTVGWKFGEQAGLRVNDG